MTFCVTLAASLAARQGATSMAAFQVCLQVWLATSLLADGLAVAGQVRSLDLYMLFTFCLLKLALSLNSWIFIFFRPYSLVHLLNKTIARPQLLHQEYCRFLIAPQIMNFFFIHDSCLTNLARIRIFQLGLVLGLVLSSILGSGLQFAAKLFTKDTSVLRLISVGIPVRNTTSKHLNSINIVLEFITISPFRISLLQ